MRSRFKKAVALAMAVSMLGGCAGQGTREPGTDPAGTEQAVDMERDRRNRVLRMPRKYHRSPGNSRVLSMQAAVRS